MLLEFLESVELFKLHVEDVIVLQDVVTLFAYLDHGSNDLILDKERMETESRELFREVMLRNWYLSKVWYFLGFWLWRESQIGRDHLLTFFFRLSHGFFHNDLVHRAVEVKFDFKEDVSGFDILFLL